MATKLHPADIADRAAIETASSFTAFVRISATDKIVEPFTDLPSASARAAALRIEHPTRDVLVYAITGEGVSIPVPKDMQGIAKVAEPAEALIGKTWGNKKSAQKAAHRAGLKHTDYDMIESGNEFSISQRRPAPTAPIAAPAPVAPIEAPATGNAEQRRAAVELNLAAAGPADAEKAAAAAKPAKPAKAPAEKPGGKRAAILEAAQRGELPAAPDFSAATHARFRKKLGEIVALIEGGDIAALKAIEINPISSSPKAMAKYRDLAVIALEARSQKEAA